MKKTITLICILMLVVLLFGCREEVYDGPPVIVVTERMSEIDIPPTQLLEEDAEIVEKIIKNQDWSGESGHCLFDYMIEYYNWKIDYSSTCGSFSLPDRFSSLTDYQHEQLNNILKKYSLME